MQDDMYAKFGNAVMSFAQTTYPEWVFSPVNAGSSHLYFSAATPPKINGCSVKSYMRCECDGRGFVAHRQKVRCICWTGYLEWALERQYGASKKLLANMLAQVASNSTNIKEGQVRPQECVVEAVGLLFGDELDVCSGNSSNSSQDEAGAGDPRRSSARLVAAGTRQSPIPDIRLVFSATEMKGCERLLMRTV
eukprot:6193977-Pleurochrysis_carterae.AAC.2